jgi:hypothetical protein
MDAGYIKVASRLGLPLSLLGQHLFLSVSCLHNRLSVSRFPRWLSLVGAFSRRCLCQSTVAFSRRYLCQSTVFVAFFDPGLDAISLNSAPSLTQDATVCHCSLVVCSSSCNTSHLWKINLSAFLPFVWNRSLVVRQCSSLQQGMYR